MSAKLRKVDKDIAEELTLMPHRMTDLLEGYDVDTQVHRATAEEKS